MRLIAFACLVLCVVLATLGISDILKRDGAPRLHKRVVVNEHGRVVYRHFGDGRTAYQDNSGIWWWLLLNQSTGSSIPDSIRAPIYVRGAAPTLAEAEEEIDEVVEAEGSVVEHDEAAEAESESSTSDASSSEGSSDTASDSGSSGGDSGGGGDGGGGGGD